MKFFKITQESSFLSLNWVYHDDAQDTLEPFHLKYYQYSMHHNLQPKNDAPNTVSSTEEIQSAKYERYAPSTSSSNYLCSLMRDTQHEGEHGLYLQRPLKSEHSHYHKSEQLMLGYVPEHLLLIHDIDTWSPKLDELLNDLHYDSPCDIQPWSKARNFIETKVAALKVQGFNH